MRDKVVLGNGGMSMFTPDCYKYQTICNKAVDNYPHELESGTNCYETQNMFDKAVSIYPSTIQFFFINLKLRKDVIKLLMLSDSYLILLLIVDI